MWALWILAAMISLTGYYALTRETRHPPPATAGAGADLAWNMEVYRRAVLQYAATHPGHAGAVADEALSFPSWYRRHPGWASHIDGRTVVIYSTQRLPADVVAELVALSRNSVLAGAADAGRGMLVSPLYGDTGLALPAGIPDGAPVWVGTSG